MDVIYYIISAYIDRSGIRDGNCVAFYSLGAIFEACSRHYMTSVTPMLEPHPHAFLVVERLFLRLRQALHHKYHSNVGTESPRLLVVKRLFLRLR